MNSRKERIRSLVEEVLQEAGPGFFGGFGAGFRAPGRVEIPQPPNEFKLAKDAASLDALIANRRTSPFLRSAAQQELRDTQREIAALPATRKKLKRAKIGSIVGGVARTLLNIPYALGAPIVKGAWSNLQTMATSADSGTLRGKGYKV